MNFTVNQLAARWSCSGAHIRNMIGRGELKAFRIGSARGYRITKDEVERWEAKQVTTLPSDGPPVIGSLTSLC